MYKRTFYKGNERQEESFITGRKKWTITGKYKKSKLNKGELKEEPNKWRREGHPGNVN